LAPAGQCFKTFFFVTYSQDKKAIALVPSKPFQPSLRFVINDSRGDSRCSTVQVDC